ncbi:endonuclease [Nonlabens sp. YIK11]|uniref:DNA/RNA non-specific endonuclease n=1 Tax=Nonlabens sp. YIK11 TaxID=1453349 RepID=UPI0006DD3486|nr:DNA/RNA non-specific endonuclease [Nonlabens sp. YIK11]KQC31920.1 endonuclease [Nonlabens sp. YIK11]
MKKVVYTIIAIGILVALFFVQRYQNTSISNENIENASRNNTDLSRADFLPVSNNQIVHHKSYSLSYNEQHEQAEWTVHVLRPSDIKDVDYERPYFEIDDMVSTGAASWRNYKNSGYDRGHLVPAGDRRGSYEDYEETFLTSNISPQRHDFNSGIWNRLEQKVRYYAQRNDAIYVVTGSILEDGLESIGSENVSVPEQFYKIIYKQQNGKPSMLAFLVPHQETSRSIYDFVVPVDSIEQITGTDFFAQLPDAIENELEKSTDRSGW